MIFYYVLIGIISLISIFTGVYSLYHFLLALFGFKNAEKVICKNEKQNKFTAVISARNEENVIAGIVKSLKEQNYPSELLNVVVIADNCTDSTAEIAENAGATVFVRNDKTRAAKGFALEWLFEQFLSDESFDSDAILVFDADNIADKNFVAEMNKMLCNGSVMAQGYRDSKNPHDNWISGSYTIYFLTLMRFFFLARKNLNISAFLGGTGFMMSTSLLRACGGWHTKEICEDVEFTMYRLAEGYRVDYAPNAVFYDEQPVKFIESWNQRIRWSTGNWNCIWRCLPLISGVRKTSFKDYLAAVMHLMSIPSMFLGFVSIILSLILVLTSNYILYGLIYSIGSMLISAIAMMVVAALVLKLENKSIKANIKGILGFPIFIVTFLAANTVGVIMPVKQWKPIKHGVR